MPSDTAVPATGKPAGLDCQHAAERLVKKSSRRNVVKFVGEGVKQAELHICSGTLWGSHSVFLSPLLLWLVSVGFCFAVVASLVCLVASSSGGLALAPFVVDFLLCLVLLLSWFVLVFSCGSLPLAPPPLAFGGADQWFWGFSRLSPFGYLVALATVWASGLSAWLLVCCWLVWNWFHATCNWTCGTTWRKPRGVGRKKNLDALFLLDSPDS